MVAVIVIVLALVMLLAFYYAYKQDTVVISELLQMRHIRYRKYLVDE
jgi:hypothetical protein